MHNQYQIENRNQSKMHMPKFFAYYNSVASAQSSIASIMNYPSSWNITQLMKMLTINSLRQGSISKTGQKYQYRLSKSYHLQTLQHTSWLCTQPTGQTFTTSNTHPKPSSPVPYHPTTVIPCPNSRIIKLWQDSTCSNRNQSPNPRSYQRQIISLLSTPF